MLGFVPEEHISATQAKNKIFKVFYLSFTTFWWKNYHGSKLQKQTSKSKSIEKLDNLKKAKPSFSEKNKNSYK